MGAPREQADRGETDLALMLRTLDVQQRPGVFVYAQIPSEAPLPDVAIDAMVREDEALTLVLSEAEAARAGLDTTFRCAWLTLTVHSSLEAVGLTAAFSAALSEAGISCNVLAGHDHDHLLVPVDRAADAVEVLRGLREPGRG